MKSLNLKLDVESLKLSEEDKKQSVQKIISTIVQNVILGYAQQQRGFDEKERRQYYKIADALDTAEKENKEVLDLEDADMGFLKKCFRETKLMPNNILKQVEDLVLAVQDR